MSKAALLDAAAYASLVLTLIEVLWPKLVNVCVMIAHDVARISG